MNRQHQDRNYQSSHHQTSYSYPPQQHEQFPQPQPNTGTYNDRPQSHHAHTSYPEGGPLQHTPSGQGYGSRSPYMETVSFPEPQHSSVTSSPPQSYFPSSRTTQNLTVAAHHQHERRGSHGHSPAIGSSSDSQRLYPAGAGSDTGGGSNFYSQQPGVQLHHGGGYTATTAPPQDWNAAVYDEGHDSRPKAPPNRPANTPYPSCRFPNCTNTAFFDRRVNERREWCSDQHMLDAIRHGLASRCNTCQVWPRRHGRRHCSDLCRSQQN